MIRDKIVIPGLKAFTTGLFACLLAVVVSYYRGSPSWAFGGLVGAGVAFIAWVLMQLPRLDPGGRPSKVYPTTTRIQITASDPAGQFSAGRFADLPISQDDLAKVSQRLIHGASFSHAGLAGPGRPLSRSQYEVLRDAMISRNLCYWINPASHAQGCNLTHAGQSVLKHFTSSAAHAHKYTSDNGREAVLTD